MLLEHRPSRLGGVLGQVAQRERGRGHSPLLAELSEGDGPVQLGDLDLLDDLLHAGEGRGHVAAQVRRHDELGADELVGEELQDVALDPQLGHEGPQALCVRLLVHGFSSRRVRAEHK